MKYTKETSNKLNELLEKNYDAEAGYIAAKDNVKNSNLKNFFKEGQPIDMILAMNLKMK